MRVLIAPDGFGGTLTAAQAADAMAVGWRRGAPHDDVTVLPLADGGPGFVDVVHGALGGELVPVTVSGPLGDPVPAAILLITTDTGVVTYLESAQAVGPHLVPPGRRNPMLTSSFGLGELLGAACGLGVSRVVVGLGGSVTNDAGSGMLAGLGMAAPVLRRGGGALVGVTADDVADLAVAREAVAGADLVAAVDVDVPLLGLHGASAGFSAQKGATREQAQDLERALGRFAAVLGDRGTPVLSRRPMLGPDAEHRGWARLPGAGAAGGLGFALAALGGRLLPGAEVVADAVGLAGQAERADLVVTGEGTLDWQSLHGKVVSQVARQAMAAGTPLVVVAGQVQIGRREWAAAGFAGVYAVADRAGQVPDALADPAGTLAARTERVARTWSPAASR